MQEVVWRDNKEKVGNSHALGRTGAGVYKGEEMRMGNSPSRGSAEEDYGVPRCIQI